jgi:hypothetical protein
LLSMLGMLPGTLLYAYIGASASSLSNADQTSGDTQVLKTALLVGGIIAGFAAVGICSWYARGEIEKMTVVQEGNVDVEERLELQNSSPNNVSIERNPDNTIV